MAVILITGIPGGGKTYHVVYDLMFGDYLKKYFVLHNIDGLKEEYFEGGKEYLQDWREIESEENAKGLFTLGRMKEVVKHAKEKHGRPVLLIVDEAQLWFDEKDKNIKAFFTWHRHEGMDIWLITQQASNIVREIRGLADYTIEGKKGHVVDEFMYAWKQNKTTFRWQRLKKVKAVFQAYRSFEVASAEKKTSGILKYMIVFGVVGVLVMIYVIAFATPKAFKELGESTDKSKGTKSGKLDSLKMKKKTEKPEKVGAPSGDPGDRQVDFSKLHLAGVLGEVAMVQDETGRIISMDQLVPGAKMVEMQGRCAKFWYGAGKTFFNVCRQQGVVQVKLPAGGGALQGGPAGSGRKAMGGG